MHAEQAWKGAQDREKFQHGFQVWFFPTLFLQEREEALERELSSKAAGGGIAAAALNKRAIGGEIVAAIREADGASEHSVPDELAGLSEAERKRAELRRALSQRIKEDLSAMA